MFQFTNIKQGATMKVANIVEGILSKRSLVRFRKTACSRTEIADDFFCPDKFPSDGSSEGKAIYNVLYVGLAREP